MLFIAKILSLQKILSMDIEHQNFATITQFHKHMYLNEGFYDLKSKQTKSKRVSSRYGKSAKVFLITEQSGIIHGDRF